MKDREILDFLKAIDAEMVHHAKEGETLVLHLIGRSAMILRYGLDLGTKDVDIVHFHGDELEKKAVEIFGKGTANAEPLGFYLDRYRKGYHRFQVLTAPSPRTYRAIGMLSGRGCQDRTTWP